MDSEHTVIGQGLQNVTVDHSNSVLIKSEIAPALSSSSSTPSNSFVDAGNGRSTLSEFEAGYLAATLLMSATNQERDEIMNIGRIFASSSQGARLKFAQLIESIRDDCLLIKTLGFAAGTKFDPAPQQTFGPSPGAPVVETSVDLDQHSQIFHPGSTLMLNPPQFGESFAPSLVPVEESPSSGFESSAVVVSSCDSSFDSGAVNGVFSLPFVAVSTTPPQTMATVLSVGGPKALASSPEKSAPSSSTSGTRYSQAPRPTQTSAPPAKRRKRMKSSPSVLSLLPKEGESLKPFAGYDCYSWVGFNHYKRADRN
eukprot:TRINITY_DN7182_c0_g1_i1.p1 TRINITY_DN7182_c0_g1~~TRINITY_DN7182_c0_g1_i1.p1  ORF type:complete len:312 (+),score=52.68 TRINITY_DN7182_c0_g1_i1:133-1068(+)